MKVALLDPGGFTPAYDSALAAALAADGHEVTFLSTASGVSGVPSAVTAMDVFPDSVRGRRGTLPHRLALVRKGVRYVQALGEADAVIRRLRPDVIHWQWLPLPLADRVRVARWSTLAPQVLTVHDATLFNGLGSSVVQSFGYRAAIRSMDRLIVHSAHGRAQLVAGGQPIDPTCMHVIPHGAFVHYATLAGDAPHSTEQTIVLPGTIKPYKGIPFLLNAFARIPSAQRHGWTVRIVGQAVMDVAPLEVQRAALGLTDQVRFDFRHLSEGEFATVIAQAGIVALPYTDIDQSGVLMSALAMGRPIVASAIGAFPETIEDGVSGLLVPSGDADALARALVSLMTSPARRETLGAAARARAGEEFAWSAVARRTAAVYATAVSQRTANAKATLGADAPRRDTEAP